MEQRIGDYLEMYAQQLEDEKDETEIERINKNIKDATEDLRL